MDKDNTIHLLVLADSSHDAEVIASTLRNNGYAIRLKHVDEESVFQKAMQEKHWDLLITANQVGDYSAFQALETINNLGKDTPCIIFGESLDRPTLIEYLRAGAADCVPKEEQEYLLIIIARELSSLQNRRAYRECRAALMESEKRNRTLLDSSRDPIAYIHEGMHIYANLSYREIFAYDDFEELESTPIMDLISGEDQKKFKDVLRRLSAGDTPEQDIEFSFERSNGDVFSAAMQFSNASIEGEACTQVNIRQQADNAELEKELVKLRTQDLLTGLYNHQFLLDELSNTVSKAASGDINSVLVYLEPDNIPAIKEKVGVGGTDIILSDIANILRTELKNAIIARFSDTIFAAIIPNQITDAIENDIELIRSQLEQFIFDVDGKTVSTTCSIGVTPVTERTPDAKTAISHAEAACATAKSKGGNHIHIHTVADEIASLEEDKAWTEKLKLALKENLFVLHFQPIVSLHAEPGERYETFIRLRDNNLNVVMPNEFLEVARNTQLMMEIDRWVMKSAAKALLEKRRQVSEICFFIKVSNDSLNDPTLLPWISKLLKAARLHGSAFVFEVSEPDIVNSLKAAKTFTNGIKQLNCQFAIDHVGTGSKDLNYLQHLHVNFMKIDGDIIANLTSSESSQEIVSQITEAAQKSNIQTIAQHVQDPACLAALWQFGINFIQGHYLQMPDSQMNYDFSSEE